MQTKYSPIAPLMNSDVYKTYHPTAQSQLGHVTKVFSNFTNRKSRIEGVEGVVNFGLQAFLQGYCIDAFKPFFAAGEDEVCSLYAERLSQVLGTPVEEVETGHVRALHRLGYLPLEFKSFPEGTVVPFKIPTFTVENTHPDFAWLTNYIEVMVSASIWFPSTSATTAHRMRRMMEEFARRTGSPREVVDFQGHDFSYRGQSSNESAMASGAGHLLSFKGSDTLATLEWIDYYYPGENGVVLGSVPASEHSVMSLGTALHGEEETYRRLLEGTPTGILSLVSDTYSLWNVLNSILPHLHDLIMARDGKLVIRPDSGNPIDIICGTKNDPAAVHTREVKTRERNPEYFGCLEILWDEFGGTVNEKGYRVLDPHVGLIYGDGMNYDSIKAILERMEKMGFASENVVMGVGSWEYVGQRTRDSFNSAMKATWAEVDGKAINLSKDPATGDGMKKSATGLLAVVKNEKGEYTLIEKATEEQMLTSEMKPVWRDGEFIRRYSFAEVRNELEKQVL